MTQKEIAKLLEVSRQTVISIENEHRNPSLELALKISETFDKPIDKIFKLEGSK